MPDASSTDLTAGELDWPAWLDRTEPRRRERTRKFDVTLAAAISAISAIETTLEDRLGVDDWRFSTAAPHRKDSGRPYANANPDDPGAVVRCTKEGDQYAVAADHYTDLRSNVCAIGLYLKEKSKMANRPVETGQSEFTTAQMPSGDEGARSAPTAPAASTRSARRRFWASARTPTRTRSAAPPSESPASSTPTTAAMGTSRRSSGRGMCCFL